ncbi:MAG: hypothetical protein L0Y72_11450 [Gemmataceae bacterium]|nr:hypothetical protein [Gemmataceae bacterium]MCI0739652.1 hypothetical protein [Gemmataceae bacterium]
MSDDVAGLRAELEQLRLRLIRLETRRTARVGMLVLGLALGLVVGWATLGPAQATQQKEEKDLVCRSLRVVGPTGKNLIFLGRDQDGGILEVSGHDGDVRAVVAVAPMQGGGLINLFDANKKLRLALEGANAGARIDKR